MPKLALEYLFRLITKCFSPATMKKSSVGVYHTCEVRILAQMRVLRVVLLGVIALSGYSVSENVVAGQIFSFI